MRDNAFPHHIGFYASPAEPENASCPFSVEYFELKHRYGYLRTGYQLPADNTCRLVFCLNGVINWIAFFEDEIKEYAVHAGCFAYDACPGGCRRAVCASEKDARVLQLRFSCTALAVLLGDVQLLRLFPDRSDPADIGASVQNITLPMNRVIDDIKKALQRHDDAYLLLLAKSLELLAMCCRFETADHRPLPGMEDRRAVQKALTILEDNLESPPSLTQLATEIGMSASKLKTLFPKILGKPPYVYLRQLRMEKAMALLVKGGVNVTEAAMEVGYSNISYFSKAFYKQFGVYPSHVRRRLGSRPDRHKKLSPVNP